MHACYQTHKHTSVHCKEARNRNKRTNPVNRRTYSYKTANYRYDVTCQCTNKPVVLQLSPYFTNAASLTYVIHGAAFKRTARVLSTPRNT